MKNFLLVLGVLLLVSCDSMQSNNPDENKPTTTPQIAPSSLNGKKLLVLNALCDERLIFISQSGFSIEALSPPTSGWTITYSTGSYSYYAMGNNKTSLTSSFSVNSTGPDGYTDNVVSYNLTMMFSSPFSGSFSGEIKKKIFGNIDGNWINTTLTDNNGGTFSIQ